MEKQLVVFTLEDEEYGVEINSVESIIKVQSITMLPRAPMFIEGVTNLRGMVIPVINLRKRFGLPQQEHDTNTRIIIASIDGVKAGMIVDGVSEVLRLQDDTIEPPPAIATTVNSIFITGIAKSDGRLIIMLDLSKVLNQREQLELQSIAA